MWFQFLICVYANVFSFNLLYCCSSNHNIPELFFITTELLSEVNSNNLQNGYEKSVVQMDLPFTHTLILTAIPLGANLGSVSCTGHFDMLTAGIRDGTTDFPISGRLFYCPLLIDVPYQPPSS